MYCAPYKNYHTNIIISEKLIPIPVRFLQKKPAESLVQEMTKLCCETELELENGGNATELLVKWHKHASGKYEHNDFLRYWKSISIEEFVFGALNPKPTYCNDLKYEEAVLIMNSIIKAELSENKTSYYIDWFEIQFPNSDISDLIYWPDEWFGDGSLFRDENSLFKREIELNAHQILSYAMESSGRYLDGWPIDVELPFSMPAKRLL